MIYDNRNAKTMHIPQACRKRSEAPSREEMEIKKASERIREIT